MSTLRQAARAFLTLWERKTAGEDLAAEADAKFDGGEFSGPARERRIHDEYQATCQYVAARMGYSELELYGEVCDMDARYFDMYPHKSPLFI